MHYSPTILRPFSILCVAINQASSPSVGPNDIDVSKTSGGENTIAIAGRTNGGGNAVVMESDIRNKGAGEPKKGVNFVIRNEEVGESNGDVKIGLEVQPQGDVKVGFKVQLITMAMALVPHQFITTMVVQPIIAAIAPVSYWLAIAISILASAIAFSICCQPAPICGARLLLLWA